MQELDDALYELEADLDEAEASSKTWMTRPAIRMSEEAERAMAEAFRRLVDEGTDDSTMGA